MKKKLMVMSVLFMTLITLTGCGGKKLTCTKEDGENSEKVVVSFKGDKAVKMTQESVEVYDSEEEAKQAKAMIDGLSGLIASQDYMEIKTEVKGKKLISTTIIDISKVPADAADDDLNLDATYDDLKKEAEEDGYKCK